MNQSPVGFQFEPDMAEKAGILGISETGIYEAVITSAIHTFGENSQSQTLELSIDSNGAKGNYIRINYIGRDGQQTFGMNIISALLWVVGVRKADPVPVQMSDGSTAWHNTSLEGKYAGFLLQKVLYTKGDGTDGYKMEVRNVFKPGTNQTYTEFSKKLQPVAIAKAMETLKDKDERQKNAGGNQSSGGWGGTQSSSGWGSPTNAATPHQSSVPQSRLQQNNGRAVVGSEPEDFDDGIPF